MPVVGLFGVGFWWLTSYREHIAENQNSVHSLVLDVQLFQFSDPASAFTFEEIQRLPSQQWREIPTVNFGYKGGTGWVRSHFFSPSTQTVLLELQSHFIDSASLWLVDEKGIIKAYGSVDYRKLFQNSHNPLMHRYPTFRLELEEGRRYGVFIRSSTAPGLTIKYNLRYWDQSEFIRYLRASDWGWALFVGAILIAVGVALLSLAFQGQRIYLYYAGYVLSLSFYALLNDGWGVFLPETLARLSNPVSIAHFLNLGVCFLLLFSREFLIIPKQPSQWWLGISPWLGYALATLFITMLHYGYSLQQEVLVRGGYWLAIGTALLMGLLWLGYWWDAVRRGFQPAWLLFAAQLVMFLFYGTNLFLVNISARTLAYPDMQIFRIALVVDLVIIAAGWVYRQKIIRQSQLSLQETNLAQQQKILEAEQRWQAEEIRALRLENDLYEQRERIARDLHDSIGSQLSHIISRLDLLSPSLHIKGSQLASLSDFARETNRDLRETIWILNREYVSFDDLATRLRGFLDKVWEDRQSPVLHCQFRAGCPDQLLPSAVALHLFRITQEATANSLKHSQTQRVDVQIEQLHSEILLIISDKGAGFKDTNASNGFGLANMRKRTQEMNGDFELVTDESGTKIQVTVPLTA